MYKNDRKSKKNNNRNFTDSFWYLGLWLIVIVLGTGWVEDIGLQTLLPICIPWMYYQFLLIIIYIVLDSALNKIKAKYRKERGGAINCISPFRIVLLFIIIPALLLLPNRYVNKNTDVEYNGIVVDSTEWGLSRTAKSYYYVKIKLYNTKYFFWYKTGEKPKPLGTKCIVSTRKGLFGMRYVEDVGFLVE